MVYNNKKPKGEIIMGEYTFWGFLFQFLANHGFTRSTTIFLIVFFGVALYVLATIALIQIIKIPGRIARLIEQQKIQNYRDDD